MVVKIDLVVVVPDLDIETTIATLLKQAQKLGIKPISYKLERHIQRDSGCYSDAHNLLKSQVNLYERALVIFDYHGSGQDKKQSVEEVQDDLEKRLAIDWGDRARVVVINPELEQWVWSDSPQVDEVLGWKGKKPALRKWLLEQGLWQENAPKPSDPKEALIRALRASQKRHSAVIFKQLAEKISVKRCTDTSFLRFRAILTDWFGTE